MSGGARRSWAAGVATAFLLFSASSAPGIPVGAGPNNASAHALAAPRRFAPITGRLSKRGLTVIALAANGKATSDQAPRGTFRLRPPAGTVTLHLKGADGKYAGPLVMDTEGKRAILGVEAGARLGRIKVRAGYARVAGRPSDDEVDPTFWSRAKKGVPKGARLFGRVRSRPKGAKVPADRDLDGIPGSFDVDDDGDLILDNFEGSGAGRAPISAGDVRAPQTQNEYELVSAIDTKSLHEATNVNAQAVTTQDVDTAIVEHSYLRMEILPGDSSELDCTNVSYCAPGGTGTVLFGPEFPECCDGDGDGFGTMAGDPFPGQDFINFFLSPHATTGQLGTGDVLIQRVTRDGQETQYASTVQMSVATVPALVSYDDGQGNSEMVSYPVSEGGPGTNGNGFPVEAGANGDVVLTVTLWRPQRTATWETGEWTDIGGLYYMARTSGPERPGYLECPPEAYSTSDPNLAPVSLPGGTPGGPGVSGAMTDLAPDQPSSPANTLSFSVNFTACFETWGLSWDPGQERELLFNATNLNDEAFLHVYFTRV